MEHNKNNLLLTASRWQLISNSNRRYNWSYYDDYSIWSSTEESDDEEEYSEDDRFATDKWYLGVQGKIFRDGQQKMLPVLLSTHGEGKHVNYTELIKKQMA